MNTSYYRLPQQKKKLYFVRPEIVRLWLFRNCVGAWRAMPLRNTQYTNTRNHIA
jgi:hypothetical protein